MKKNILYLIAILSVHLAIPASAELVLVEKGVALTPVVVFENAPPITRRAADELAEYINKMSGVLLAVLEGQPDPLPESAIWVGYQPVLQELFPDIDFEFQHPEEILIAANAKHLVIAGRDRWDPERMTIELRGEKTAHGIQQEYGTHNAVYTFLQDYLGVRWLWPGALGVDVREQKTISLAPFEYRYHPQVRARDGLLGYVALNRIGPGDAEQSPSGYWSRAQRLQLCELPSPGGHGFPGDWWGRFHEKHPEYFALQPDGTRGGGEKPYPGERTVKMCESNPDIARQWLDDVAAQLELNPNLRVFNASPGDAWYHGHCICENCRAWDHPDGEPRPFTWQGITQEYVALSDRDITFANRLARGLKERFPDRELYLYMLAYGHSRPAPVAAVPDDNVIIGNVANFLLRFDRIDAGSTTGKTERENFANWGKITKLHFWRPNVGSPVGWSWGMPDVPLSRTIKDFKFVAENNWMGIFIDYVREHWATQGPMYYLMAQLIWNPDQDGQAILKDYYDRAFGPAKAEMEAYWTYMEQLRETCYGTDVPGVSDHDIFEFYDTERLGVAQGLLDRAAAQAVEGPEVYRQRIAFVQAGLDFTRLTTECGRLVQTIKKKGDPDGEARTQINLNWEKLRKLRQEQPDAIRWNLFFEGNKADSKPRQNKNVPLLFVP